jgi:hypothetical protein
MAGKLFLDADGFALFIQKTNEFFNPPGYFIPVITDTEDRKMIPGYPGIGFLFGHPGLQNLHDHLQYLITLLMTVLFINKAKPVNVKG